MQERGKTNTQFMFSWANLWNTDWAMLSMFYVEMMGEKYMLFTMFVDIMPLFLLQEVGKALALFVHTMWVFYYSVRAFVILWEDFSFSVFSTKHMMTYFTVSFSLGLVIFSSFTKCTCWVLANISLSAYIFLVLV